MGVLAPVFKVFEDDCRLTWKPSIARTVIMGITLVSALIVPYFGEFITVLGALTLIAMQKQIPTSDTIWQMTIMLFGTAAMAIGLYSGFAGLIEAVKNNPENLYQIKHLFEAEFWISSTRK